MPDSLIRRFTPVQKRWGKAVVKEINMIRVITNDEDSGDWCVVMKDGEIIHSGHSLNVYQLATLCGVEVEDMSDDDINRLHNTAPRRLADGPALS